MRVGELFNAVMKAADLQDRRVTVTISGCQEQLIGEEKERKAVLYFEGKAKGLALNFTNYQTLLSMFGTDDSDIWKGKRIVLYTEPTAMGPGIRIAPPQGAQSAAPRPTPPPPPPAPAVPGPDQWQPSDDDVPF